MLNNLKTAWKLGVGFAALLLIFAGAIFWGWIKISAVQKNAKFVESVDNVMKIEIDIDELVAEMRYNLHTYRYVGNPESLLDTFKEIEKTGELIDSVSSISEKYPEILSASDIKALRGFYGQYSENVRQVADKTALKNNIDKKLIASAAEIDKILKGFLASQYRSLEEIAEKGGTAAIIQKGGIINAAEAIFNSF